MHKAWVYKRKNRPGWYVRWYTPDGRQHSRQAPTKHVAEQYAHRMEVRLNDDLFADPVGVPWDELVAEYLSDLRLVKRSAAGTIESYEDVLSNFKRLCGPALSTRVASRLRQFVAARTEEGTAPATINKDLRTLRAFINWAVKARYMADSGIAWHDLRQRTVRKSPRSVSTSELARLIEAATALYGVTWRLRIMLAVTTGMRRRDIEHISLSDIDLDTGCLKNSNQKAYKEGNKPLHQRVIAELHDYTQRLPAGQIRLFGDKWHDSKWGRIKARAAITGLKYHDLRVSCASFVIQAGYSTSVAQNLLEHSSPSLTHSIYTDVNPVYRQAVNAIPLDEALTPPPESPRSDPATP